MCAVTNKALSMIENNKYRTPATTLLLSGWHGPLPNRTLPLFRFVCTAKHPVGYRFDLFLQFCHSIIERFWLSGMFCFSFPFFTNFDNTLNKFTSGTRTAYTSGAHECTPRFQWGSCCFVYSVLTTIVCLFVLCLLVFTLSLLIFHPYCILKTSGTDWHTSLNWVVHLISPAEQPECSFKGMVSYIGRKVPVISIKAQVLHSKS